MIWYLERDFTYAGTHSLVPHVFINDQEGFQNVVDEYRQGKHIFLELNAHVMFMQDEGEDMSEKNENHNKSFGFDMDYIPERLLIYILLFYGFLALIFSIILDHIPERD